VSFDPNTTSKDLIRDLIKAQIEQQHSQDIHRGRITAETEAVQKQLDGLAGIAHKSVEMLHLLAPQVQEHEKDLKTLHEAVKELQVLKHQATGMKTMWGWMVAAVSGAFAVGMGVITIIKAMQ